MRRAWLIVAAWLIVPAAQACNVPVFRYALERWKPDPHDVFVFQRGKLSKPEKETLDLLKKYGPGEERPANLELTVVDLDDKPDAALVKLYEEHKKPALPAIIVRARNLERQMVTTWVGKFDEAGVRGLVESPLRQKLARRLANGETAVWVLLESGDVKKDAAAREALVKEFERITPTLKLPELTDNPEDRISQKGPPLRISFTVLPLKRDDPAEEVLRSTLLRSEDDLAAEKEPMVFPVFGRGRTLGALVGKGIVPENIAEGCKLLVAPCSCKIKAQSPGFDLPLSFDWDGALDPQPTPAPKPEDVQAKKGPTEPITIDLPPTEEAPSKAAAPVQPEKGEDIVARELVVGGIAVASLLVLLTGFWLIRSGASA